MLMMRTLRDMNMSKFVAEDVPLFLSLIDDMFPGLRAERSQFPEVMAALEKVGGRWGWGCGSGQTNRSAARQKDRPPGSLVAAACLPATHHCGPACPALQQVVKERGLQAHPSWMNKCIQLYETYLVRGCAARGQGKGCAPGHGQTAM